MNLEQLIFSIAAQILLLYFVWGFAYEKGKQDQTKDTNHGSKVECFHCGELVKKDDSSVVIKGQHGFGKQEVDYFLHKKCAEEINYLGAK